jgi:hypothetical protein
MVEKSTDKRYDGYYLLFGFCVANPIGLPPSEKGLFEAPGRRKGVFLSLIRGRYGTGTETVQAGLLTVIIRITNRAIPPKKALIAESARKPVESFRGSSYCTVQYSTAMGRALGRKSSL